VILKSYRVSPSGNSCGLAVFRLTSELPTPKLIHIEIFPKFWTERPKTWFLDLDSEFEEQAHGISLKKLQIYEGDLVTFGSESRVVLNELSNLLLTPVFSKQSVAVPDEPVEQNFFAPLARPESGPFDAQLDYSVELFTDFWDLVEAASESGDYLEYPVLSELDSEQQAYFASLSEYLNLSYKQSVLRRFVEKAEEYVLRRPKFYGALVEKLNVFRGSPTSRGWVEISQKSGKSIEFEFDEISDVSTWDQIVAAAAMIASTSIKGVDADNYVERSLWISSKTFSGSSQSYRALLGDLSLRQLPKGLSAHKEVFRRAIDILRNDFQISLGQQNNAISRPVASVRLRTSLLFELVLNGKEIAPGVIISRNLAPQLRLRHNDVQPKIPDFALVTTSGAIVGLADAKYKTKVDSFSQMPMSDQYQQYAYAQVSGLPTFFIYVGAFSMLKDWAHSQDSELETEVILTSVPFPRNGNLSEWWSQALQENLL
jgi:hypothetical protein